MKMPGRRSTFSLWRRLRRAEQALRTAIEADLKAAELPSMDDCEILLAIFETDAMAARPSDLQPRTALTPYNLSRAINRLDGSGHVERRRHPDDGRGRLIVLTALGQAVARRAGKAYAAALDRHLAQPLGQGDAFQLADILKTLAP